VELFSYPPPAPATIKTEDFLLERVLNKPDTEAICVQPPPWA
jgi:hypothetical protein